MRMMLPAVFASAALAVACGPGEARERIEERPLDQAVALDNIQQALAARNVQSERFQKILLPNRKEWVVDVVATNMPLAVEFLSAQDRERVGDGMPIQAAPDETPRIIAVTRVGPDGNPAGNLYLRTFTDEHFYFQPNPPPDMMDAPYTIREVTARLRRDVIDFVAWHVATHGAENAP